MLGAWSLVRFVHVASAAVWVGGQVTVTAIVMPILRRAVDTDRLSEQRRGELMRAVGLRFGVLTGAAFLPVQVSTGVLLAWHKGVTWSSLATPGYGRTLAAKLVAFALVMVAAGGHGWAQSTGRAELARALALGSLGGSLAIVLLATALPAT